MKRVVFTLLAAGLMSIGTACAQGLYYGPRVGMNISSLTKTTYAKSRVRTNFGVMAGYTVNDLIGVQAEVLYSLQGYKISESTREYTFNYIKVPMLAKLYIVEGLNVEAGISFNFMVKARMEQQEQLVSGGTATVKYNVKDDYRKFDFSIPVGINYQFVKWFDVGLRYDISTLRVPKDSRNKARDSNWALNVGFRF